MRHIFVDIGMGFQVEFTWLEALEFITLREARLARYSFSSLIQLVSCTCGMSPVDGNPGYSFS